MKSINQFLKCCSLLAFAFLALKPAVKGQDDCVVNVRVNSSSDDAEESGEEAAVLGKVSLMSSDLEMTFDGVEGGYQIVGIRFNNVQAPNGASVSKAYIQFTSERVNADEATTLTIRGESSDNALTFSDTDFDISSRATTSAAVTWMVPAWNTIGEAGPDQRSADISGIIEETLARPGWAAGNSLVIVITGGFKRVAESYDGAPDAAPLLHIEFSGGEEGCPGEPTPCDDEDPTTEDVVDIQGNCLHFKKVCDDGDPQTRDYFNDAGECVSEPIVCDDGDDETEDYLDENGVCHHVKTISECDECPDDPDKTKPGECGCGAPEPGAPCDDGDECTVDDQITEDCECKGTLLDTDGDGTPDCRDWCPEDPNKVEDGYCGCGNAETDTDGDGTPDCMDWCPEDPNKVDDGHCGCGNPEPGTPCDDGDECTVGDKITEDCECKGRRRDNGDCDDDDCDREPGTPCDDGKECTINDRITEDCECRGERIDTDHDGTPDCEDICPDDPDDLCGECPDDLEDCGKYVTFVACDKVIVCANEEVSNIIVDLGPTGFQNYDVDLKFGNLRGKRWTFVSPNGEKINGIWVKTASECDRCHEDEEMYGCVECVGAACPEGDKAGPYFVNDRCECTADDPGDRDEDGIPDCADDCPDDAANECGSYECPDLEDCEKTVFFPACDKVIVCAGSKIKEVVVDLGRSGFQNYFIDRKYTAIHGKRWEYKAPWGLTINGVWVKTKGRCAECRDDEDFSCEDCDGAACPRDRDSGRYYPSTQDDCGWGRRPRDRDRHIDINIFPNPTSNFIRIILGHLFNRRGSLEVLNAKGDRIHKMEINEWNADDLRVDMGAAPQGLYFLRVVLDDGEVLIKQFVVAN